MNGDAGWRVLDAAECWSLLASARHGYVACSDLALPAIVLVELTVVGDDVVVRSPHPSALDRATAGNIVCLYVDDHTSMPMWRVSLIGPMSMRHDGPWTGPSAGATRPDVSASVRLGTGLIHGARRSERSRHP